METELILTLDSENSVTAVGGGHVEESWVVRWVQNHPTLFNPAQARSHLTDRLRARNPIPLCLKQLETPSYSQGQHAKWLNSCATGEFGEVRGRKLVKSVIVSEFTLSKTVPGLSPQTS